MAKGLACEVTDLNGQSTLGGVQKIMFDCEERVEMRRRNRALFLVAKKRDIAFEERIKKWRENV